MTGLALTPRLILLMSVAPALWAGNVVVSRMALDSIGPLWLNLGRWGLALLLILPLSWRAFASAQSRAAFALRWRHMLLLSLLGVGAYNALQYLALSTSTPLNVTLIASSAPVWTVLIGALAYAERPRAAQMLGALLSLSGVAVVLSSGDPHALLRLRFLSGDMLMLAAIICWSAYSWMLARPPASMVGDARPAWTWAEFLALQIAPGVLWAMLAAGTGEWLAPAPPIDWSVGLCLTLLYVALGPSLIAYRAWGLGVAQAGPAVAAFMSNLTPLFAALLSGVVLGQWPQAFHGLAFALIVAGIVVSSRAKTS